MSGDDSQQLILSPLSLDNSHSPLTDPNHVDREGGYERVRVSTPHCALEVARELPGPSSSGGPVLVTLADLGLNHLTNYSKLLASPSLGLVTGHFTIYHVSWPGQEPGAAALEEQDPFPSMEQLSESLEYICHHFGIASFIGLASGFGANVLMRLARRRPRLVEAVILFNADSAAAGWLEWGRGLVHAKSLAPAAAKGLGLPPAVAEWLVWHHLGGASAGRCPRLAESYRQHFLHHSHPANLLKLIQCYNGRDTVKLARDIASNGRTILGANRTLKMPCLNMVGEFSPHVDLTVDFNGRLDPEKCTWMKLSDASMVVVEQTEKVAQAITLFIQGLGYSLRRPAAASC